MIKKIIIFTLFTIALSFLNAGVDSVIKPFAGLDWDDNLLDVILKIKNIKGVENFSTMVRPGFGKQNLFKINNKKDLQNIFIKQYWIGKKKNSKWPHHKYKIPFYPVIDMNGKKTKILRFSSFTINASPIIIHGVPFSLKIYMDIEKGLAAQNKDKLIYVDIDTYISATIREVLLYSNSKLINLNKDKLFALLNKKYKKFLLAEVRKIKNINKNYMESVWNINRIMYNCKDKNESQVYINLKDNLCSLRYSSVLYSKKIRASYRIVMEKYEQKKVTNKTDNSKLF